MFYITTCHMTCSYIIFMKNKNMINKDNNKEDLWNIPPKYTNPIQDYVDSWKSRNESVITENNETQMTNKTIKLSLNKDNVNEELLRAADKALEDLNNMTDEELMSELENCEPGPLSELFEAGFTIPGLEHNDNTILDTDKIKKGKQEMNIDLAQIEKDIDLFVNELKGKLLNLDKDKIVDNEFIEEFISTIKQELQEDKYKNISILFTTQEELDSFLRNIIKENI